MTPVLRSAPSHASIVTAEVCGAWQGYVARVTRGRLLTISVALRRCTFRCRHGDAVGVDIDPHERKQAGTAPAGPKEIADGAGAAMSDLLCNMDGCGPGSSGPWRAQRNHTSKQPHKHACRIATGTCKPHSALPTTLTQPKQKTAPTGTSAPPPPQQQRQRRWRASWQDSGRSRQGTRRPRTSP